MEDKITETVRRTININDFESLVVEGSGRDNNPRKAYLLAERDLLIKARSSLIRIYYIRSQHNTSTSDDKITYSQIAGEIQGIDSELASVTD